MMNITKFDGEIILKILKDFSRDYNANSISKEIGISSRGALKILNKLKANNILISKNMGKAVFYKINFEEIYTRKLIETLLLDETRQKVERWTKEFKDIFNSTQIVILFGSVIRNEKAANDIDVIFVFDKGKYNKVKNFVEHKNKILFKKIHEIPQTISDLKENLRAGNKALVDAVRTGYVLHGQDKLVEVIRDVTSF